MCHTLSFSVVVLLCVCVCVCVCVSCVSGYVNGTDVVHLLHRHGAEDSLSVAARSCDKSVTTEKTCSSVKQTNTDNRMHRLPWYFPRFALNGIVIVFTITVAVVFFSVCVVRCATSVH